MKLWACRSCGGTGVTVEQRYNRWTGQYGPRVHGCSSCERTGLRWGWAVRLRTWWWRANYRYFWRVPTQRCSTCGRLMRILFFYLPGECGDDCLPF